MDKSSDQKAIEKQAKATAKAINKYHKENSNQQSNIDSIFYKTKKEKK